MAACNGIARVGKRGYVETPNVMEDVLFCQAAGMNHRWHTLAQGGSLYLSECTERQQRGSESTAWSDTIWAEFHHPPQDAFADNQHLFNTMFRWQDGFSVVVVARDGSLSSRDVGSETR